MERTDRSARDLYVAIGALLERPSAATAGAAEACMHLAVGGFPEVAPGLAAFAGAVSTWSVDELEELHLRTFVVAPSCVPYVGVHLYGEESFKRGELMALLRDGFARHDYAPEGELPDHVAVLLRFAGLLPADELHELETWLLALPVEAMAKALAGTANPYGALLEALEGLVTRHGVPDDVREALARSGRTGVDAACSSCASPAVPAGGRR